MHGAKLLKAIRQQFAESGLSVEFFGIGGPHLQKAGLEAIVDARDLLSMGFTETIRDLPKIFRAFRLLTQEAQQRRPDLAIVIDYPEFHFKLAKKLKALDVPVVYYIPPKVWVWRKRRVGFLKETFKKVLVIFPFEKDFYLNENLDQVEYVGNPLLEELPFELTQSEARKRLGLGMEERVLTVMPGSRKAECQRHFPLIWESCKIVADRLEAMGLISASRPLQVLLPVPSMVDLAWLGKVRGGTNFNLQILRESSAICLLAADAGIIKSGTSTLEAGLLGCPHTVIYQVSPISNWIFKNLVRYQGPVSLTNLILSKASGLLPVKEFVCENAVPAVIAEEVLSLMADSSKKEKMLENFRILREKMKSPDLPLSPSQRAAQQIYLCVAPQFRSTSGVAPGDGG